MHATFPSSSRLETIGLAGDEGPFLDPLEPPAKKRWPWHLALLLILTVLAGVSRFYKLDQPPIWGDEASTFRRVSGMYEEMLVTLERDPFGPLFYEIEWAIRQHHPLTPFWLRLIPAIAGTLMIPAMYFLARQVRSIRTAMAAAVLTLCSAWLINYGRDAKMYMTFWLFVTLSAGCFLWWARTRTWTAWLCWIAASCAMVGINPWGAIVLALSPIWLLTSRRVHWGMGLGWVVGVLVILIGPVGYFQIFNHWRDKAQETGHFTDIDWVRDRNEGAGGLDLVQDSASAFLYSFTFIQESAGRPIPPQPVLVKSTIAISIIVTLLALGALPWRRTDQLPPPSAPEPWWRPTLWIGLWLIVPTYLFYCISVHDSYSPNDWLTMASDSIGGHFWLFGGYILATTALVLWRRRAGTILLAVLIGLVAIVLLIAIKRVYAVDTPDPEKWRRPIEVLALWPTLLYRLGVPQEQDGIFTRLYYDFFRIVPIGIVIVSSVALARAGRTYRQRLGALIITVLIVASAGYVLLQIHTACAAALKNMEAQGVHPSSIWVPRYLGFIWPAVILTVAALLMRLPTWPVKWLAVIGVCALNLYVANNRVLGHTEPPMDRIVADIRAADGADSTVRTYVQNAEVGSGPGGGSLFGHVGKYYMLNDRTDIPMSPDIFSDWQRTDDRDGNRLASPSRINNMIKNSPKVDRLIVWRPIFRDGQTSQDQDIPVPPADAFDALLQRLGPTWKRTRDEVIPVRYHWSWAELYLYRRREYEKQPTDLSVEASSASTTQPTTRP